MRKLVAALIAVLMIPVAASAAPMMAPAASDSPNYATARVGMYMPQASDVDPFNAGLATELQFGRRFHQNFAAEGGLGWFSSSTDEIAGSKLTLSVFPVTATAKGILPFGKAELYGLGGVGLYMASLKLKTPAGSATGDDTGFGFHVGAGSQYSITSKVSLGVEARYLIASADDFSFDGFMFNGGVAFHF